MKRQRRQLGFDIPANLSCDGSPSEDSDNWLVVCRECGFHVETRAGRCWNGCPGCGASLWVIYPGEDGAWWLAEAWHPDWKPRRRRNAWRTAMPTLPTSRQR